MRRDAGRCGGRLQRGKQDQHRNNQGGQPGGRFHQTLVEQDCGAFVRCARRAAMQPMVRLGRDSHELGGKQPQHHTGS